MLVDEEVNQSLAKDKISSEFPNLRKTWFFILPKKYNILKNKILSVLSLNHPGIGRYRSDPLIKALNSEILTSKYSLIHFDMIHMSQYYSLCKHIPKLLVASDAYSRAAFSAKSRSKSLKQKLLLLIYGNLILNYEKSTYRKFEIVCTVSEQDSKYLYDSIPSINIRTIGIPIGQEYVCNSPRSFNVNKISSCNILCTGPLSMPNHVESYIEFLSKSSPQILKVNPSIKITVLGRNPTKRLLNIINQLPNVYHIAYVQDYVSFLSQDWVYLYPLRCSTGLQTKVQQAMALGLPVIGFKEAFGGLGVDVSKHCLQCHTNQELIDRCIDLIRNVDVREEIGLAAASYIRKKFSIEKVGKNVISIYHKLIKN